ncbi:FtsK/SpoIIIE domain-containing protein [Leucobacter chromiiresistens]|uniref:DNA segregation ATPase FtsK/SpoIIIE, S-DNA-T family n=1 Tax=Leucobacter chromiiresistens TaxID=1079994 RepID=A0A1H0XTN6_9MICO|nr:FtsK/SpoIIIE domain-containing protein [Leucobacter chromiiresistens]SDQ05996.1 DNA segregation ATPase FtsK/SpoIIIE, S-DNA-T family [Leucobacter chromiiresistens]
MKLKLTLVVPRLELHDVTLSCDVTATVADAARALLTAGITDDPRLRDAARDRLAPVTLRGRAGGSGPVLLLDPMSPIGASGLQSGWIVEPVAEFGTRSGERRVIEIGGYLEVMTGAHAGATYSLIAGVNTVGRDQSCRVHLGDRSVSRRHAEIEITAGSGAGIVIRDLGSANGTNLGGPDGQPIAEHLIRRSTEFALGEVVVRITPGPPVPPIPALSHRVMHTRAPRLAPVFPASLRELPAPPAPAQPNRIPMLAMLAPMMMGGAMFVITQSPMSLMMVAFSPIMMIGSWLDTRIGGKRKQKRDRARFEESLAADRAALAELRRREIEARSAETPAIAEIADAVERRSGLLWTRRPEHRAFLEVRFGDGVLPSRTQIELPARGDADRAQWDVLQRIATEFSEVAPVPLLERFERCGSIGVVGDPIWAEGMARSLLLQLVGLHSPTELVIACFASPHHAAEWEWLKWLPHVDAVTSPIGSWQLADDERSSIRLIAALEGLLALRRSAASRRSSVRSHLDGETRNDEQHGDAIDDLPTIPAVIVLVLDAVHVDLSRIIALAEDGPDFGIHALWVARAVDDLPAACRTYAELGSAEGAVSFVRSSSRAPLQRLEPVESMRALELARRLAPVEDTSARALDESDLPKAVHLRDLHAVDLLGGAQPVLRAWHRSGSVTATWRLGEEREPISLAAVVGQSPDGPAIVDLRLQGPHALVGGTTGAGKSEFLQSWIMSLAATVGPDRLTFLLVDYKGGAAFAECVDLPHTVGLVTDLSPHLVHRALASLRAELHHREELLAAHGAKDLIAMERRSDAAAPPVLVIVIDEFAALAAEVPQFIDGVIDIAQRGRSLGLHLVMATQRPAGVISDNLRANTNLRVALRMADAADSSDVLGVADAASFAAETPGRGAMKVGPGRARHFQTGYLGGRAVDDRPGALVEVRSLGFAEGAPWSIPPPGRAPQRRRAKPPRDIERLRDGIVAAAREAGIAAPRRPWLDALPEWVGLDALRARALEQLGDTGDAAILGLRDQPTAQAQRPVPIDLEEAGNVAFVGASGTGKTSALVALAASLSASADAHPVQLYAIDAGGGALDVIDALPTVGAVAQLADRELTVRVLRHLVDLVAERCARYAAARASGLRAFRRTPGGSGEARVVLLIDGFAAFRQSAETRAGADAPMHLLSEIMSAGRSAGVHVVMTSDRAGVIPSAMSSAVQQQYVLRLAGQHGSHAFGVRADLLADAPPGRAVLAGTDEEIQIACVGDGPGSAAQARGLERLADELRAGRVAEAVPVRNAPTHPALTELPVEVAGRPAYGIDTDGFAPLGMPLAGLGVIAGPPGSGLSTAARTCVHAYERWAAGRGAGVERVLLTCVPHGLRAAEEWDRVAFGTDEVRDRARALTRALGGRPPSRRAASPTIGSNVIGGGIGDAPVPEAEGSAAAFPSAGWRGVVVIERPADTEGTEALPELVALARAARRSDVLVLFEWEQGSGAGVWDLFTALRQPTWGLALQPDDSEGQTPFRESLGRVKRADFPAGRGVAIESGRVTPVHVALPGGRAPEHGSAAASR